MVIFKFEQRLGTMTAEEAYCRLYNRPSRWRRIADFEDDNECYNLTGFYRDQLFIQTECIVGHEEAVHKHDTI
jgi:hypothetical protein